jgi:hypothetical protein
LCPIPRKEREGFKAGGVETRHEGKASFLVNAVMILGGVGTMAAGKRKS